MDRSISSDTPRPPKWRGTLTRIFPTTHGRFAMIKIRTPWLAPWLVAARAATRRTPARTRCSHARRTPGRTRGSRRSGDDPPGDGEPHPHPQSHRGGAA